METFKDYLSKNRINIASITEEDLKLIGHGIISRVRQAFNKKSDSNMDDDLNDICRSILQKYHFKIYGNGLGSLDVIKYIYEVYEELRPAQEANDLENKNGVEWDIHSSIRSSYFKALKDSNQI